MSRALTPKHLSEIANLERQDSSFNPDDLEQFARENPSSELAKLFTWNDSKCGIEWRRMEARAMLRAYIVITKRGNPVRLVSIPVRRVSGMGSYMSESKVQADVALRDSVLDGVRKTLAGFKDRYGWLDELSVVWNAID